MREFCKFNKMIKLWSFHCLCRQSNCGAELWQSPTVFGKPAGVITMSVYLHDILFTPLQIMYIYVCVDCMIQVQVYRTCVNLTIMVNFWDVTAIIKERKQNKTKKEEKKKRFLQNCITNSNNLTSLYYETSLLIKVAW